MKTGFQIFRYALAAIAHGVAAAEYYVAPTGDDGNRGTAGAPWKTLARATAALQPGDTCYLRGGVYRERLVGTRSGTSGAYITYAAFPGETPVLDGTGVAWGSDPSLLHGVVDLEGQSYVCVRGLEIRNSARSGIGAWSAGEGSHLLIENNVTVTAANDDWGGGALLAAAFAGTGAFALPATSKDAALLVGLPPGNYTAMASGVGGASGRVLLEVYEVP